MKWETKKVDEFCYVTDYVANGSFASLKENVIYRNTPDYAVLVRVTDFTKNWNGDYVWVDESSFSFLKKSEVYPGDLVMANVGEPGKCFIVPDLGQPMTLGPNAILIRPDTSKFSTKYLYHYFSSTLGRAAIDKISSATTQSKFNKTSFRALDVPLPPLQVQKQIADTLDKADALRRKDQELLQKYDKLAQSIFYDMFGDPIRNEREWKIGTISEMVEEITAGTSIGGEDRNRETHEVAVLKISAVTSGTFKPEEYKIPEQSALPKNIVRPQKGDLLFSRANTRELVGATAVVDMDYPWLMLPDKLWKLHMRKGMSPYFLRYLLWDKGIRFELNKTATGTSGSMLNISMSKLKALNIPIPYQEYQMQFEKRVMQIGDVVRAGNLTTVNSDLLFNNLLAKYFS